MTCIIPDVWTMLMMQEATVVYNPSRICLEELKQITKSLNEYSCFPDRQSNLGYFS